MFENTFSQGSIIGLFLLAYSVQVGFEIMRLSQSPNALVFAPRIALSSMASVLAMACIPALFWPIVYVAMFDGLLAGALFWILLQVGGGLATVILRIRGELIGIHVLALIVALPVGYVLTWIYRPW